MIIAQSWIWRQKNTIVFDNIETLNHDYSDLLASLYAQAGKNMIGKLGVKEVRVGAGYDDLGVDKYFEKCKDIVKPPKDCYSDAKDKQYLISSNKKGE